MTIESQSSTRSPPQVARSDGDESVAMAIVEAVASAVGRPTEPLAETMTALDPLYETVDPEALETLLASADGDASALHVRFAYAGCEVAVDGDGTVTVLNA